MTEQGISCRNQKLPIPSGTELRDSRGVPSDKCEGRDGRIICPCCEIPIRQENATSYFCTVCCTDWSDLPAPFVGKIIENLPGYSHPRVLEDGRWACIAKFLFTTAIIVGTRQQWMHNLVGDRWCYHNLAAALSALNDWNELSSRLAGIGIPTLVAAAQTAIP